MCVCFGKKLLTAFIFIVFSSSQLCNCSDLSQATSSKMLTFDTTCNDTVKMKPAPEKFRHHGLITVYLNKVSFCSIVEQTGRTLADICCHGNTTTGSSYITQGFLSEFAFSNSQQDSSPPSPNEIIFCSMEGALMKGAYVYLSDNIQTWQLLFTYDTQFKFWCLCLACAKLQLVSGSLQLQR